MLRQNHALGKCQQRSSQCLKSALSFTQSRLKIFDDLHLLRFLNE